MYNYTFLLTPARNKSDIAFTSYKPLILEAINNINNGLAFKRDCKKIFLDVDNIYDKEITLILSSKNMLTNPSRSLSALTRYLTTYYSETFHPYVYNKTLFNINLLSQETSSGLTPEEFSNEELLKAIIDLLYSADAVTNKSKKDAILQIKKLIIPFINL